MRIPGKRNPIRNLVVLMIWGVAGCAGGPPAGDPQNGADLHTRGGAHDTVSAPLAVTGRSTGPAQAQENSGRSSDPRHEKLSENDLLIAGERIYHEGILLSGRPLSGTVAGDVAFEGTHLSCQSCHRNSGLGSQEGDIVAPIITQWALYRGKHWSPRKRPAYTDETLIRALREGIDPAGNKLDPLMPRYRLGDDDARALIAYLNQLSAAVSPGVTDTDIHFATVVSEDIDAKPITDILERYFADKNNELRNPVGRKEGEVFYRRQVDLAYRKWKLHVWRLKGDPSSWTKQLKRYYQAQPVFALISGQVTSSWEPIHAFCENLSLPCILPITNHPVTAEGDWWTMYFSGGLDLESKTIAKTLQNRRARGILQIYRANTAGETAAESLERKLLDETSEVSVVNWALESGDGASVQDLAARLRKEHGRDIVAWLDADDLRKVTTQLAGLDPSRRLFLSSSLLGADPQNVPKPLRSRTVLAHPFSLSKDFELRFARTEVWLRTKGIPVVDRRRQAQAFFVCLLLREALMHVRFDYYYRDFLMETLDHVPARLGIFCPSHPALSFGPSQRFVSKGCYIVTYPEPKNGRQLLADWVVP